MIMRILLTMIVFGFFSSPSPEAPAIQKDKYLGLEIADFEATGYFRLEKLGDRWFMVTPEGHPFYRLGINGVTFWYGSYKDGAFTSKYKQNMKAWGQEAVRKVKDWGFNVLEYRTTRELIRMMKKGDVEKMPYSITLTFVENQATARKDFPDVFSTEFEALADSVARFYAKRAAKDPYLIGYFLGNELDFDISGDRKWRSRWVRKLMGSETGSPAFKAFIGMLKEKYGDARTFNEANGTSVASLDELDRKTLVELAKDDKRALKSAVKEFNTLIAEKFYQVTTSAIKKYDQNHLILGSRFGGGAERDVLIRTAPYTDIISLNKYTLQTEVLSSELDEFYRLTGKPLHHSEFCFLQAGRNADTDGAVYPPVDTQRKRGELYRKFTEKEMSIPYLIGFSWYEFVDPTPRMNFGLINKDDEVYQDAVSIIAETNRELEARFAEIIKGLSPAAVKKESDQKN